MLDYTWLFYVNFFCAMASVFNPAQQSPHERIAVRIMYRRPPHPPVRTRSPVQPSGPDEAARAQAGGRALSSSWLLSKVRTVKVRL